MITTYDRSVLEALKLRAYKMIDEAVAKIHPVMVALEHTWEGAVPSREEIAAQLMVLIRECRFGDRGDFPLASASCGGLHVEIVVWPRSSPTVQLYYAVGTPMRSFRYEELKELV